MEITLVEHELEPQWNVLCMLWNYLLESEECTVYEISMQVFVSTVLFLIVPNHEQHYVI